MKNKIGIVPKEVMATLRKIRYVKSVNIQGKKNSKNAFYNVYDASAQMDVIFEAQKCGLVYFYKNGINTGASSMMCFAWFIWEKGYSGSPIINWIL